MNINSSNNASQGDPLMGSSSIKDRISFFNKIGETKTEVKMHNPSKLDKKIETIGHKMVDAEKNIEGDTPVIETHHPSPSSLAENLNKTLKQTLEETENMMQNVASFQTSTLLYTKVPQEKNTPNNQEEATGDGDSTSHSSALDGKEIEDVEGEKNLYSEMPDPNHVTDDFLDSVGVSHPLANVDLEDYTVVKQTPTLIDYNSVKAEERTPFQLPNVNSQQNKPDLKNKIWNFFSKTTSKLVDFNQALFSGGKQSKKAETDESVYDKLPGIEMDEKETQYSSIKTTGNSVSNVAEKDEIVFASEKEAAEMKAKLKSRNSALSKTLKASKKIAKQTGQMQTVTLENGKFVIVKPSGTIYVAVRQLGKGNSKATLQMMRVSTKLFERLKSQPPKFKAYVPLGEAEAKIYAHLKQQSRKGAKTDHISLGSSVYKLNDPTQYAVLNPMCNGSVNSLLSSPNPLSLKDKCHLISQMAQGLKELHQAGIVHRDLNPGNFLFNKDEEGKIIGVEITDFGESSLTSDKDGRKPNQAVFPFMAPEWAYNDRDLHFLSPAADIYSFGMLCFSTLFNIPFSELKNVQKDELVQMKLFSAEVAENLLKNNGGKFEAARVWKNHVKDSPKLNQLDKPIIRDFLLKMLSVDPADRPTLPEIIQFFEQQAQ